ncbi:MAG: STAS domain-containing protein [Candidatus Omnitrophota bacterium]
MSELNIEIKKTGENNEICVAVPKGSIDTYTLPIFQNAIEGLIKEECQKLIVDFGSADFISSAGMGFLITTLGELQSHGGDIKLSGMSSDVYEMFELLGLDNVFRILTNQQEAVEDFQKGVN